MPLEVAPGTAPEPSFDHLAALAMGGAPHAPNGAVHPTETPAAAHRRQGELTFELTDSRSAT